MPEEATQTPTALAEVIYGGGLTVRRRVADIDTPAGAARLVRLLDEIITAAQELRGAAAHIVGDDEDEPEPLAGEWVALTADREYGIHPETGGGRR